MLIALMIILFILGFVFLAIAAESWNHGDLFGGIGVTSIVISIIMLICRLY